MDKKSSRAISETRALLTNQAARTVPSPGASGGYFTIKTGNSSQPLSLSQATQYIQSHFTQI
jgi:hypothetical protein